MRLHVLSVGLFCVLKLATSYQVPVLHRLLYPVALSRQVSTRKPALAHLFEEPYVLYRSTSNSSHIVAHTDICPHMGAALHKGWLDACGGLHCCYHGFEFDENGMFCRIPNPVQVGQKRLRSKIVLPTKVVKECNGVVFLGTSAKNSTLGMLTEPYFPPEEHDNAFRKIEGVRLLPQYQDIVTENLLDNLHISYVHSFGNRLAPIPFDVETEALNETGFRTRFLYTPKSGTLSTDVGRVSTVEVENEIHLPSTTITRVTAGQLIKTVHTMACPVRGKQTLLFWSIYRNFWRDPYFPVMDVIGDWVLRFLMERTIDEDANVLADVYEDRRLDGGLWTRYDVTIRKYRDLVEKTRQKDAS